MPHDVERDNIHKSGGGEPLPWTRREHLGDPQVLKIGSDPGQNGVAVSISQQASTKNVVTIDNPSPADSPPTESLLATSDPLVCSQCTFNNCASAAPGAPALPAPSACAVCLNPLPCVASENQAKSSIAAVGELPRAPHPGPKGQGLLARGSGFISTAETLPANDAGEEMRSTLLAKTCPLCTVLVLDPWVTNCHVCGATLAPPTSESDLPMQVECSACTLRNDPRATVCSVCETPLAYGDGQTAGTLVFDNTGMLRFAGGQRAQDGGGRSTHLELDSSYA